LPRSGELAEAGPVVTIPPDVGAPGVLVVSCPPRDCWSREGPVWLEQRLHHDREAELRPRVDKRRVRVVHAGEGERGVARAALLAFRDELRALGAAVREDAVDVDRECEVPVGSDVPTGTGAPR